MSELKPCPFCGSDDLVMSSRETYAFMTGKRMGFYRVKCDTCGAMVDNDFEGTDEAIEAWNRRVDDKVGKWIEKDETPWVQCSLCGVASLLTPEYCPKCRARMEIDFG